MQEEQWGDVRDYANWKERQAAIIAQNIKEFNGGHWPLTNEEWIRAAARYDLVLRIIDADLSFPAMRIDNTIIVRYSSRPSVLQRRICHEIAEAVAEREIGLRTFLHNEGRDANHDIAGIVEQNSTLFIQHEHQQSEKRKQHIERRLLLLREQLQQEDARMTAAAACLD